MKLKTQDGGWTLKLVPLWGPAHLSVRQAQQWLGFHAPGILWQCTFPYAPPHVTTCNYTYHIPHSSPMSTLKRFITERELLIILQTRKARHEVEISYPRLSITCRPELQSPNPTLCSFRGSSQPTKPIDSRDRESERHSCRLPPTPRDPLHRDRLKVPIYYGFYLSSENRTFSTEITVDCDVGMEHNEKFGS